MAAKPRLDRCKIYDLMACESPEDFLNTLPIVVQIQDVECRDLFVDETIVAFNCHDGLYSTDAFNFCTQVPELAGHSVEEFSIIKIIQAAVIKPALKTSLHNVMPTFILIAYEVLIPGTKVGREFCFGFESKDLEDSSYLIPNYRYPLPDTENYVPNIRSQIVNTRRLRLEIEENQQPKNVLWSQARNKEHVDVSFNFPDGSKLWAHKVILCSASEVFQTHFDSHTHFKDKNEIIITDSDADTFKDFLHFLYKGYTYFYNLKHYFDLYYLGEKYLITKLKHLAKNTIMKKVFNLDHYSDPIFWKFGDPEDECAIPPMKYIEAARLNQKIQDSDIKDRCSIKSKFNASSIVVDPEFLNMSFEEVTSLFTNDPVITPDIMLKYTIRWAIHNFVTAVCVKDYMEQDDDPKEVTEATGIEDCKDQRCFHSLFDLIEFKYVRMDSWKELMCASEAVRNAIVKKIMQEPKIETTRAFPILYKHNANDDNAITCCSVDISDLIIGAPVQTVFCKIMELQSMEAEVQVMFKRKSDNTGKVELGLTVLTSEYSPPRDLTGRIEFVLYDESGNPRSSYPYFTSNAHDEIMVSTQGVGDNVIGHFNVHQWGKLIDPNEKAMNGGSVVHCKIYLHTTTFTGL